MLLKGSYNPYEEEKDYGVLFLLSYYEKIDLLQKVISGLIRVGEIMICPYKMYLRNA